ncbi:MAG: DUF4145 domain-containing protein [Deltaproteobacteria bacterium]|nr:DUF4145 domain-containing protein [Deltaproteobacteria bacterium]
MATQWTCPYCNRHCTIGEYDDRIIAGENHINEKYGHYVTLTRIIVCPNPDCEKRTISLAIFALKGGPCHWEHQSYQELIKRWDQPLQIIIFNSIKLISWNLLPESTAKPFPDYIPAPLRKDYEEACLIVNKSPKASATLSRRCLQGIIRDFYGIKKKTLAEEINELQSKVDSSTWDAMDSLRHVGNIGAHMENDINLIIDVEENEATLLINLIETLFVETYINRHDREQRMSNLKKIADDKKQQKSQKQTE